MNTIHDKIFTLTAIKSVSYDKYFYNKSLYMRYLLLNYMIYLFSSHWFDKMVKYCIANKFLNKKDTYFINFNKNGIVKTICNGTLYDVIKFIEQSEHNKTDGSYDNKIIQSIKLKNMDIIDTIINYTQYNDDKIFFRETLLCENIPYDPNDVLTISYMDVFSTNIDPIVTESKIINNYLDRNIFNLL